MTSVIGPRLKIEITAAGEEPGYTDLKGIVRSHLASGLQQRLFASIHFD